MKIRYMLLVTLFAATTLSNTPVLGMSDDEKETPKKSVSSLTSFPGTFALQRNKPQSSEQNEYVPHWRYGACLGE